MTRTETENPNPFTMVYDALLALVKRHPLLSELVKANNWIEFGDKSKSNPIKVQVTAADLPEVTFIPDGITNVNIKNSSSTTVIGKKFTFVVVTGDMRVNEKLHQIEWALFCALNDWTTTLTALQWHGKNFVKSLSDTSAAEGESDSRRSANMKGFTAIWSCTVGMMFDDTDLIAELET